MVSGIGIFGLYHSFSEAVPTTTSRSLNSEFKKKTSATAQKLRNEDNPLHCHCQAFLVVLIPFFTVVIMRELDKTLGMIELIRRRRRGQVFGKGPNQVSFHAPDGSTKIIQYLQQYEDNPSDTIYYKLRRKKRGTWRHTLAYQLAKSYLNLYSEGRRWKLENGTKNKDLIEKHLSSVFDCNVRHWCRNMSWCVHDMRDNPAVFELMAFLDGAPLPNGSTLNDAELRRLDGNLFDYVHGNLKDVVLGHLQDLEQRITQRIDAICEEINSLRREFGEQIRELRQETNENIANAKQELRQETNENIANAKQELRQEVNKKSQELKDHINLHVQKQVEKQMEERVGKLKEEIKKELLAVLENDDSQMQSGNDSDEMSTNNIYDESLDGNLLENDDGDFFSGGDEDNDEPYDKENENTGKLAEPRANVATKESFVGKATTNECRAESLIETSLSTKENRAPSSTSSVNKRGNPVSRIKSILRRAHGETKLHPYRVRINLNANETRETLSQDEWQLEQKSTTTVSHCVTVTIKDTTFHMGISPQLQYDNSVTRVTVLHSLDDPFVHVFGTPDALRSCYCLLHGSPRIFPSLILVDWYLDDNVLMAQDVVDLRRFQTIPSAGPLSPNLYWGTGLTHKSRTSFAFCNQSMIGDAIRGVVGDIRLMHGSLVQVQLCSNCQERLVVLLLGPPQTCEK